MGKERPAPRRLPLQRGTQRLGVRGQDHQVALAAEVAPRRFAELAGGGEMDESVGPVDRRALEPTTREGGLPGGAAEYLVDPGHRAPPLIAPYSPSPP